MNTPTPVPVQEPSSFLWYLKWTVIVGVLIYLYFVFRPYFGIFVKLIELMRVFLTKAIDTTGDLGKDIVDEAAVGSKLVVNKISKPSAKSSEPKGYCVVGNTEVRNCARVDKSQCSTQLYSTESQCVNPTL